MSYCKLKKIIEENDTVIIYLSPKQMYRVKVEKNETFQTRYGAIRLENLIGKNYGCRYDCSKGFVHILDMTPELWTLTLPHRTQILYGPDISLILMHLQLKSGSSVIEAGTGSGSLSHSIARTISPNGKLFTYDFHQERVLAAKNDFFEHGLDSIVNCQHGDVCQDGFNNLDRLVDAVFLDLPHPWQAIGFAQKVLKNGGRICCFSPCIEQVQRSCQQMSKLNFFDIETLECVLRPYEVRNISLKKVKLFDRTNSSITSLENDCEIENDNYCNSIMDQSTNNEENDSIMDQSSNNNENNSVMDQNTNNNDNHSMIDQNTNNGDNNQLVISSSNKRKLDLPENKNEEEISYWTTYTYPEIAGHTGFLTFATNLLENS